MSDEESATESSSAEEELYEVDKVVDHRNQGKKVFYRVRWKGYPPSQDTWEPQEHLGEGCDEIITAYFELKETFKGKQKKKGATVSEAPVKNETKKTKASKSQASLSVSSATASTSKSTSNSASSDQLSDTDVFVTKPKLGSTSAPVSTSSPTKGIPVRPAADKSVKMQCAEVEEEQPVPCSHQSEYKSAQAKEYDSLTRRFEVAGQTKDTISELRKCITVLISQLCDPTHGDLAPIFEQLQTCLKRNCQNSGGSSKASEISLMTAIPILNEDAILSEKYSYTSAINKAIPGNWTPLHFAAALHKFDVCDWLLEELCWPDIVTINQETPLTLVLKNAAARKNTEKLLKCVNKLIAHGANMSHTDASGKTPAAIAKKNRYNSISNHISKLQTRLSTHLTSVMASHLSTHLDDLYLKDYFIEPQVITQPCGLTYTLHFKFTAPAEPCVARLTVAYSSQANVNAEISDSSKIPLQLTTKGPFPCKSINLNGHSVMPQDTKFMSVTLQSELVVGDNVLELEMRDSNSSNPPLLDSVALFGCLIARSPGQEPKG